MRAEEGLGMNKFVVYKYIENLDRV